MSSGTRIRLGEARELAEAVTALIGPACERVAIVGSIRRKAVSIGDIEILCIPKFEAAGEDLFGNTTEKVNMLDQLVQQLLSAGTFTHRLDVNGRPSCGHRYKRLLFEDVGLDLFSCLPPAQWGVLELIRTGPADYSHEFVKQRKEGGKVLPPGYRIHEGQLLNERGQVIPTPTERSLFAAVNKPYLAAECRR